MQKGKNAFTLIELLIVIAIIAILAGVVLAVINPAQQRKRSNQAVARGNIVKACLAYNSCVSALNDQLALNVNTNCATQAQMGLYFAAGSSGAGGVYTLDGVDTVPATGYTTLPKWTDSTTTTCVIQCDSNGIVTADPTCLINN